MPPPVRVSVIVPALNEAAGMDAALQALAPDFAGFRSAVCAGDRRAALDPQRLHRLAELMHADDSVPAR